MRIEVQTRPTIGEKGIIVLNLPDGEPLAPLPIIVGIHGGGWEGGDRTSYDWCWDRLYRSLGPVCFVQLSHRPSSEVTFPGPYEDCVHVLKWLRAHSDEYRLDCTRCVLLGCSSGGHLAALLATRATRKAVPIAGGKKINPLLQQIPAIRGAAVFCGILDFGGLHDPGDSPTYLRYYIGPVGLKGALEKFMGGRMQDLPDAYVQASPIEQIHSATPPMFLCHGDWDDIVPIKQSRKMAKALNAAGFEPVLLEAPGSPHFTMNGPDPKPEQCAPTPERFHAAPSETHGEQGEAEAAAAGADSSGDGGGEPAAEVQPQPPLPPKRFVYEKELMDFLSAQLRLPVPPSFGDVLD